MGHEDRGAWDWEEVPQPTLQPYVDYRAGRVGFLDTEHKVEEYPYADSIDAARRWLGDRYLCHEPINKRGRTK